MPASWRLATPPAARMNSSGSDTAWWSFSPPNWVSPSSTWKPTCRRPTCFGDDLMGALLRRMFGQQMIVFGFAFNQGSFQAQDQGKVVRDCTVPPAPTGSLYVTLAATGIPRFE